MRLTNDARQTILSKAMGDTNKNFQKKVDELKKREEQLAEQCYNATFDAKTRKLVQSIPDKWLREDDCLRFNVNGMDIRLQSSKKFRVPSKEGYGCNRLGVITDELAGKVVDLAQDKEKLKEEHGRIRAKLNALLENCSTLKMLQTTWPEGKPFYDYLVQADKQQKAALPAVLISDINSMLGLK